MQPEIHKLLLDIEFALLEIQEFTAGMNLSSYQADSKSNAAVERKFEIIGEACSRIRNDFPEEFEKIRNGHKLLGFETVLSMVMIVWMMRLYGMFSKRNCPIYLEV